MGKTRGVHETTPELRNRMVGMYEAGLGLRDIAAAVNCSQRTVKRWLNRFDKEGTVETRERCGRKRATTTEEDDAIIRLATQTPITAAKAVLPALGLTCSVDTIRERLHKAGIHNWSPSRKHMQRLPLGEGDGATIQQAVWRPTGTQLGKKKLASKGNNGKSKKSASGVRKKARSLKIRARDICVGDGAPADSSKRSMEPAEFVFSEQNIGQQESATTQANSDMAIESETLSNGQFGNALGLVQGAAAPQMYQHHHGLNVAQNWPLDLVQGSHHYPQGQPHSLSHEEPPPRQHLQELHTQREQEHQIQQQRQQQQQLQRQFQEQIPSHNSNLEQHRQPLRRSPEHEISQRQRQIHSRTEERSINDRPGKITRSNSCTNSSIDSNDQSSDIDELSKYDSRDDDEEIPSSGKLRKKKGGKAKGTLETSVEMRNRMIGMSEAGLSTLSIALAINRSERTVKRWLERWNKEGNVQTKERKGRRRITTKEQDDAIIAMATQQPLTAAKHVAPALGLNCSVDTIRERLHKAGIHSWKLGKKQGEGNNVHTVHLWQPSGNRPNKPKLSSERRKKSSVGKKRVESSSIAPKRSQRRKKSVDASEPKIVSPPPPPNIIAEPTAMQYHDNGPHPEMLQPVHDLSGASLVSSSRGSQVPSSLTQTIQAMGPMMQPRPDCRMENSVVTSHLTNPSVAYPSCMINGGNNHMDQSDSLNYEPYIWSF